MYVVRILKRRDAASVVVAIVLGLVLSSIVSVLTVDLSAWLSGLEGASIEWREDIIRPLIHAALQLVLLELLLRVAVNVRPMFVRRKR